MQSGPPITLLALSHLRWDFVFQRPQHLMKHAACRGMRVIYVEEPLWGATGFGERVFGRDGVTVVQPLVPDWTDNEVAQAHARTVVQVHAGTGPLWLWFYTPMALPLAEDLAADVVVFDKMDELSAFDFAPAELITNEAALMARADVVFTGGRAMFEAAAGRNANLHCFPSSVDTAHFSRARGGALGDPADQAGIAHPRIGFFGVIDERFDVALLRVVAAARPDWQFIMLGPTAKIDEADLPRATNIHWLGGKPYAELPAYLAHWDAGWMPFAINKATRFISPTKTPEFLAAGLPVVSTPIADVIRPYGEAALVEIAADPSATVAALDRALEPPSPDWLSKVDHRLAGSSWASTFNEMNRIVEQALRNKLVKDLG